MKNYESIARQLFPHWSPEQQKKWAHIRASLPVEPKVKISSCVGYRPQDWMFTRSISK